MVTGKKQKPNARNEYWVSLRVGSDGRVWIDTNMTYYSDAWHWSRREKYESLVDYTIRGENAVMYIIDWDEMGYDRCKKYAFQWVTGDCFEYRLD